MKVGTLVAVKSRGFAGEIIRPTRRFGQKAYVVRKKTHEVKRATVTVLAKNIIDFVDVITK